MTRQAGALEAVGVFANKFANSPDARRLTGMMVRVDVEKLLQGFPVQERPRSKAARIG